MDEKGDKRQQLGPEMRSRVVLVSEVIGPLICAWRTYLTDGDRAMHVDFWLWTFTAKLPKDSGQ